MSRYRVIIDRGALARAEAAHTGAKPENPILVLDAATDELIARGCEVHLGVGAKVVYDAEGRPNGAKAWVECDDFNIRVAM